MKQLIIFILAGCIVLLSGCQSDISTTEGLETEPSYVDATWHKVTDSPNTKETVAKTESATVERSDETPPTKMTSAESEDSSLDEKQKDTTAPTKPKVSSTTPTSTPSVTTPTVPKVTQTETEPIETTPKQPETEPTIPASTQPETETTVPETTQSEPTSCSHDWQTVHHEEKGHWRAGIVCDCGWTVYGNADELISKWNAHSASFPTEEALFQHGGYGSADEWIVDSPAYDERVCRLCGETQS